MAYLDFDTLLICNNHFDEESVKYTFELFKSVGIRKFIFTYDFDRELKPMSQAIQKLRTLKPYLSSLAPRGLRIYTAFNVPLSEGSVFAPSFKRLAFGHSDRIFAELPFCNYDDWLETDMNRLLYKNKLKPAFVSFERSLSIVDRDITERFMTIKNAVFCMDINYLTSIEALANLERYISLGINFFPCVSSDIFNYPGIIKSFDLLKDRIGKEKYFNLCKIFYASSKMIMEDAEYYPRKT